MFEKLKPEFVAPLTLYLCTDQCPVSGAIYNAGMGYYNRVAVVTGTGAVVGEEGEEVADVPASAESQPQAEGAAPAEAPSPPSTPEPAPVLK